MGILSGTGILDGTGILSGKGILFQPGILVPPSIDPDAAAYIAAVEAAGATVTGAQRTYINDFYVAAKADYYTSLKRLYLPIWGVAAANAIDMITLASGTFNGGVTHGAGFVQGNGSTGYFRVDAVDSSIWTNSNSFNMGVLKKTRPSTSYMAYCGNQDLSTFAFITTGSDATNLNAYGVGNNTNLGQPGDTVASSILMLDWNGTTRRLLSWYSGALNSFATNTVANDFAFGGDAFDFMESIYNGPSDFQMGAGFCADSLGTTNGALFAAHLETLWEGCTGLTLP